MAFASDVPAAKLGFWPNDPATVCVAPNAFIQPEKPTISVGFYELSDELMNLRLGQLEKKKSFILELKNLLSNQFYISDECLNNAEGFVNALYNDSPSLLNSTKVSQFTGQGLSIIIKRLETVIVFDFFNDGECVFSDVVNNDIEEFHLENGKDVYNKFSGLIQKII
jgi:hypothetical protein